MAGLDEMRIKIGADISDLITKLKSAQGELEKFSNTSANSVVPALTKTESATDALEASLSELAAKGNANIKSIADRALGISPVMANLSKNVAAFGGGVLTNKVPEYFKKVGEEATKASVAVGSNVKAGSDKAAFALQNLGRIAQDAPFGFIGIQNNINPLLESFQRLKAETGSTSGAFKAMAAGLTGAGGLGLAVSVATSILTVLAINGFFKTEKAADDAKKKIEAYKDAIKGIFNDAGREAAEVSGLVAVLESETATRQKKLATIKELQRINPEVFSGLKMEGEAVVGLDTAYKDYIANLRTVIAVKAIQKKLEDSISQSLEFQGATSTKSLQDAANFLKNLNDKRKEQAGYIKTAGDLKYDKQVDAENKRLAEQVELQRQLTELQAGIKVTPLKDPKDKAHIKDVNDVLKELDKELALNQQLAGIGFISSAEEDTAKIQKVKAAIEELLKLPKGRGLSPNSSIISDLIGSIQPEEARAQLTERMKELSKGLSTVSQTDLFKASDSKPITIPANVHITTNIKAALAEVNKEFTEAFNKTAKDIQKSVINSGLSNIGETIGSALGGGDVAGAFEGLLQTVISGMKQLGEAMIALGTAKIALEHFNLAPGIGTVIAGVGIIALSSAIQAALPKFAGGVTGFGGGMALVGENGPEMVRLPQGSDVIPNHRLNTVTGGGAQVIVLTPVVRGADLLLLHDRASQQRARRG